MQHINLPQKRNKRFYDICQQQFVELSKSYPDILAVYGAGTVAHPGISDLDFVLCLKDHLTQPLDIEDRLSDDLRHIIGHGSVLKVNRSNIKNIKIIDDFPLVHVDGEQYTFAEYSSSLFELCRVLDWLPERLVRLAHLSASTEYDAIRALQVCKSVTVSLHKLGRLTGSAEYQPYIQSVQKLRSTWFRNPKKGRALDQVLLQTIEACIQALNKVDEYVQQKGYIIPPPQTMRHIRFSIKNGPAWRFAEKAYVKGKRVYVPYTVGIFLLAQAQSSRQFMARHVRASFSEVPKYRVAKYLKPDVLNVIHQRMAYLESVTAFFHENDLKRGLLKYGWFFYA